jgi:flagellar basal body-associated protein FliL
MTTTLPSAVDAGPGINDAPGSGTAGAALDPKAEKKAAKKSGKDGAPKKKKLPKMIMLLVLVAGVGFVAKGKLVKPHYKPGQQAPDAQVLSLTDSSGSSGGSGLTTSLSDGHMIQVSIALQLTKVASTKTLTDEVPRFLDAAVSVLSGETYTGLLQATGQDDAKLKILAAVQKIAGTSEGAQQIDRVYFESLIVQ